MSHTSATPADTGEARRERKTVGRELSRRNLIRGRFVQAPVMHRPPYAIPESDFRSRCTRCKDCETACPTGIIGRDSAGFPKLRFGEANCTFCGDCAEACKAGSLNPDAARPWSVRARIDNTCLSINAVTCRTCEESCEAGAIRFRLMTGGRALALVDTSRCNGCGACAVVCPSKSIEMADHQIKEKVA